MRLRAAQFREDAGPLAHPVRPEEYVEINNFYTATVYEKGAEVIGMLRRLVGPETYREGARPLLRAARRPGLHHRGLAAGLRGRLGPRPRAVQALVHPGRHAAAAARRSTGTAARYRLDLAQETPPTPGQPEKAPLVDPGRLRPARPGRRTRWPRACSSSTRRAQSFAWELPARPVPSLLRGFSAPVILEREADPGRARVPARPRQRPVQQVGGRPRLGARARSPALAADPGGGRRRRLPRRARRGRRRSRRSTRRSRRWRSACPRRTRSSRTWPPPGVTPDPLASAGRGARLEAAAARALGDRLERALRRQRRARPLQPRRRAPPAGGRCARGRSALLTALDPEATHARAQFAAADNMTERMARAGAARRARPRPRRRSPTSTPPGAHDRLVDRQVVRGAGRAARPPEQRGRHRRGADPPPGLRLEEPEPLPGADRQLRHGQPGRLPRRRRRRLPAGGGLADPARPGEPADHGAARRRRSAPGGCSTPAARR